jgi:hypothetical protein
MALAAGATESEMESAAAAAEVSAPGQAALSQEEWMLDCIVDLTEARPEDEPLLELVRIGT